MKNEKILCYDPAVYAVEDRYEIVFKTYEACAAWVVIDGVRYTDNFCGVVRSSSTIHKVRVKQEVLDRAKKYTVVLALIPERPAYFPKTTEYFEKEYSFRPLPEGDIHAYMLADTHSKVDEPAKAAEYFGEGGLDLLILGGDNGNTADDEGSVLTMAKIASKVTKGEIPVVYMRGNHDTRGAYAEFLGSYVGTDNGKTYFPVKLGRISALVLDAGEDKLDTHEAYGDIADYTEFRLAQLELIKNTDLDGEVKLLLCHVPFASFETPFSDVFAEWTKELNKKGIDLMLAGHTHALYMFGANERSICDTSANFPVCVGSAIDRHVDGSYVGTAIIISKDEITLRFTDAEFKVHEEHKIKI